MVLVLKGDALDECDEMAYHGPSLPGASVCLDAFLRSGKRLAVGIGAGVPRSALPQLFKIKDYINAEWVGTREAADLGLITDKDVVGMLGKQLYTDVYLALGISGSTQHMWGVNCDCLMAVNHNDQAAIWQYADVGKQTDVGNFVDE